MTAVSAATAGSVLFFLPKVNKYLNVPFVISRYRTTEVHYSRLSVIATDFLLGLAIS